MFVEGGGAPVPWHNGTMASPSLPHSLFSKSYELSSVTLEDVEHAKYLGITLSNKLERGQHVDNITKNASNIGASAVDRHHTDTHSSHEQFLPGISSQPYDRRSLISRCVQASASIAPPHGITSIGVISHESLPIINHNQNLYTDASGNGTQFLCMKVQRLQ